MLPKGAVAVSEQDGEIGAERVRHRQVQIAIVIEVCNNDGNRALASSICSLCVERAIAIAQQDNDVVAISLRRHREIQYAIMVKISDSNGCREGVGEKRAARFELG